MTDTSSNLLRAAYEDQGFVFGTMLSGGGTSRLPGAIDGVQLFLSGPTPKAGDELELTEVSLNDLSAGGEDALKMMGFTIGIFAPEAESWLVEQLNIALANPGEAFEVSEQFEFVTLTLSAFTDQMQSIELTVE